MKKYSMLFGIADVKTVVISEAVDWKSEVEDTTIEENKR